MPRKKVEAKKSLRSVIARSPEIQDVSRKVASLALTQMAQEGQLNVRQTEQLRRSMAAAGGVLEWGAPAAHSRDAGGEVSKDVLTIAKNGAKYMAGDLVDEMERKKNEIQVMLDTAQQIRKVGESSKTEYPVEITYNYTARDGSQRYTTKLETLTLNDAEEAEKAANKIEGIIESKTKLADLMLLDLEQKQIRLEEMKRGLPDFVKSSRPLLDEVMANL